MSASTAMPDMTQDASGQVLVGCVVSILLTLTFFTLRMTSKWLHERKFDMSDTFLAASVPVTLAIDIIMMWARGPPVGLGHHADPTDAKTFKATMQALLAVECIYTFALAFIKMSFFLLYLRLFPGKTYRIIIKCWIGLTIVWAFAILIASIFQCKPVEALWTLELRLGGATCLPLFNFYIAIWVPNIATDLVILALPQVHVWKLQVELRTRIALACTFFVGAFAVVANIVRFTTFWQIDSIDIEYTLAPLALWTALELAAATTCASLVTMRPLLMMIYRRSKGITSNHASSVKNKNSRGYHYQLSDLHGRENDTTNLVSITGGREKHRIMVTNDTFVESTPKDAQSLGTVSM